MSLRACLRLLLLAAMLLAPLGRLGMAQAMAAPSAAGMAMAHCAGMPAAPQDMHHQKAPDRDGEKMAVDCMIACAAMAAAPAPFETPAPIVVALPTATFLPGLTGICPEADPPPPRSS